MSLRALAVRSPRHSIGEEGGARKGFCHAKQLDHRDSGGDRPPPAVLSVLKPTHAAGAGPFDGTWNVEVDCADVGDVRGCDWRFPTDEPRRGERPLPVADQRGDRELELARPARRLGAADDGRKDGPRSGVDRGSPHAARADASIVRHTQRNHSALEKPNIKLASVISDILALSGRRILKAIMSNQTDQRRLADLGPKLACPREELVAASDGRLRDHPWRA